MKRCIDVYIGRVKGLAALKHFYEQEGFGMTIIYGCRHIGKSTLISEFVKDRYPDIRRIVSEYRVSGGVKRTVCLTCG